MKEIPILFSAPMVRAILDGRKIVTRRVCTIPWKGSKRAAPDFLGGAGDQNDPECWGYSFDGPDHHGYVVLARGLRQEHDGGLVSLPCPYGEPGDRLWVKETHAIGTSHAPDDYPKIHYRADMVEHDHDGNGVCPTPNGASHYAGKWRPSIFMPRWASRILLEVVSVRVERLQEITESEALAEGLEADEREHDGSPVPYIHETARGAFSSLWDSLNKARGYGWDANPWVWRVEFRRVES